MSAHVNPYPMPVGLRDSVNMTLLTVELSGLDNEGRFVVRRLVADAYSSGFSDGRVDQYQSDWADRQATKDAASALESENAEAR